ncbi:molybdenum cofactor guanylyltransferase [Microbacterium gilvum]|uniref:molybdenum cofactor guanylyltransferase n=1 Tax=Microbacterium gilvum TaxID=1336204 RepID=UPI0031E507B0
MTAAIVLAGGRATRVGGADKALFEVGGRALLAHALAAAAWCRPLVVVGPERGGADAAATWVREHPPHGGPVAALAAGLAAVPDDSVLVLAADLPRAEEAVAALRGIAALHPPVDGVCLADDAGRPQWLLGLYDAAALRRRVASLPDDGAGARFRDVVDGLDIAVVRPREAGLVDDVDTWEDLERARGAADRPAEEDDDGR